MKASVRVQGLHDPKVGTFLSNKLTWSTSTVRWLRTWPVEEVVGNIPGADDQEGEIQLVVQNEAGIYLKINTMSTINQLSGLAY